MRKFDLSLRSSRSSYFATFRHQLTILSKTDALDEEKWLNMLGTFVKDWFRYESHFVHGRDSLVDILKERGLLFFFSSRRRHTSLTCDWSSVVCSSDLSARARASFTARSRTPASPTSWRAKSSKNRSEERRVGKESRSRGSQYH